LTGNNVRNMPRRKRVDARTAIISVLVKGPRPPRELKCEVLALGVPKSSHHYALRQLIKHGDVNKVEPMYSYRGQRLSDRDVRELLGPVTTAESEAQQIERSKNLVFLAKTPGIVLQPRFLSTLEECLHSDLADVRTNALSALADTLCNLDDAHYAEDKKAREVIGETFFELLASLAKTDEDLNSRGNAIETLAKLGDPKAIEIFAELIEKTSDEEYRSIEKSLQQAIVWGHDPTGEARNFLTRYHHHRILKGLSELAAKGNERASKLADQIRRQR